MNQQASNSNSVPAPRVLIVDDDPGILDVLTLIAEKAGCVVKSLQDGERIAGLQDTFDPDVIFLDLYMPKVNGIDVVHMLGERHCRAKLLLMSGLEMRTLLSAKKVATNFGLDVIDVIEKPFGIDEISNLLQPFVTRMKTDTAESCYQTLPPEGLGPVLFFERIKNLVAFGSSHDSCFRLSGKWRLDTGEHRNILGMLNSAHSREAEMGLIELEFRLLKLELLRLSPNLSEGLQFVLPVSANSFLVDSFSKILNRGINIAGLDPEAIYLEILDLENVADREIFLKNLTKLDVMGFKISYSVSQQPEEALTHIKELPLNDVVIDMSAPVFINRELGHEETHFDYGSLVSFANREALTVSAKNIRSSEHLQFASRCGITRVSGSVIQQPVKNLAESVIDYDGSQKKMLVAPDENSNIAVGS